MILCLLVIGVGKGGPGGGEGGGGGHWPPQCLDRGGLAPPICSIKIIYMHDFAAAF